MLEVIQALKYLYKSGIINDSQFQYYFNRCNEPNVNIDLIKEELIALYNGYNNSSSSDFDFDIIEIDDPDGLTGIVPIDMFSVDSSQSVGEQVSSKSIGGKQKKLGTLGNIPWTDENGFMSFLFISFLTGISIGIISMIVINFVA